MQGYGYQLMSDGTKYEGNFLKGNKHGYGKYIWNDASTYSGN
jgi:hypothetical protein